MQALASNGWRYTPLKSACVKSALKRTALRREAPAHTSGKRCLAEITQQLILTNVMSAKVVGGAACLLRRFDRSIRLTLSTPRFK
eukprot:871274-Pleurochrysis_carterae.AAC.2